MNCPRCESKLEHEDSEYFCHVCNGVLVNINELPSVSKINPNSIATLRKSQIDCPSCGVTMRELMFRGVEIDICSSCNYVWLDFGEDHLRDTGENNDRYEPNFVDDAYTYTETAIFVEDIIRNPDEFPRSCSIFDILFDDPVESAIDSIFD